MGSIDQPMLMVLAMYDMAPLVRSWGHGGYGVPIAWLYIIECHMMRRYVGVRCSVHV